MRLKRRNSTFQKIKEESGLEEGMIVDNEGKTKKILRDPRLRSDIVIIMSKPDITARDGEKHDVIIGKDEVANETTCNCFELLEGKDIRTHFLGRRDKISFYAWKMQMIRVEVVIREIAAGSCLKRNPTITEGTIFKPLVVELFFKNNKLRDPFMLWNTRKKVFEIYKPDQPITPASYIRDLLPNELSSRDDYILTLKEIEEIRATASRVFLILKEAWEELGLTLFDMKIEFGWSPKGELLLADVIDNDSWRLRKRTKVLDKDVYRDGSQSLKDVEENYVQVAELTKLFKKPPLV